jgi:hypothetical protein
MPAAATKMRQALGGAEFSGVEHKERTMVPNNRLLTRMEIAAAVDLSYKDYLLELSPNEAIAFISKLPDQRDGKRDKVLGLLHRINDLIPPSAITKAGPGHTYRIGRRIDRRIIYLSLSGVHFPRRYRYASLLNVLWKYAKEAGALHQAGSDEGDWEIMFWWL